MPNHLTATVLEREARGGPNAALVLISALVTSMMCAAVCAGAILAPAPAAAVPVVVAICIGGPLFAAWELPAAVARLRAARAHRSRTQALLTFRRNLDRLPETEHPLGL